MKGIEGPNEEDVWFGNKTHSGTKYFRRVIRFTVEDYEENEYSKEIFKFIKKELKGRRFYKGATHPTECSSFEIAAAIGEAFEAEQERRTKKRSQRKRQRKSYQGITNPTKEYDQAKQDSERGENRPKSGMGVPDIENQKNRIRQIIMGKPQSSRQRLTGEDSRIDDDRRIRKKDYCHAMCCIVITGLIAAVVMGGVGYFDKTEDPPKHRFFTDPWTGSIAGNATRYANESALHWSSAGRKGLDIEILNAADDSWITFIEMAINDWNNGDPIDPLTLSLKSVDRDIECIQVDGKIKVCNSDYGDNDWRGLNDMQFYVETNEIVSSAAKLNDFYLQKENDDQKLYTVCHELGHAFGLPHWDEDFLNQDLNNCMDYTIFPQFNNRPDTPNFYYLAQLYGDRNNSTASNSNSTNSDGEEDGVGTGRIRSRRVNSKVSDPIQNDRMLRDFEILHSDEHFEIYGGMISEDRAILRYFFLA